MYHSPVPYFYILEESILKAMCDSVCSLYHRTKIYVPTRIKHKSYCVSSPYKEANKSLKMLWNITEFENTVIQRPCYTEQDIQLQTYTQH